MALQIERRERPDRPNLIHVDRKRLVALEGLLEELQKVYADSVTQEEIDSTGSVFYRMKGLGDLLHNVGLDLQERGCFDDPEPAMRKADVERVMDAGHMLYMAIYSRLVFLKGAKTLANERATLLEDADIIEAAVPTIEQLERIERNRRYLERSINAKFDQIERVRALRDQGKTCHIKRVA